eukprot:7231602-Ditylum_brightwellii.AAC.1
MFILASSILFKTTSRQACTILVGKKACIANHHATAGRIINQRVFFPSYRSSLTRIQQHCRSKSSISKNNIQKQQQWNHKQRKKESSTTTATTTTTAQQQGKNTLEETENINASSSLGRDDASLSRYPKMSSPGGILRGLDYLGTVTFALTGSVTAAQSGLDVFGCCMVGMVTGVGGGTIRDA